MVTPSLDYFRNPDFPGVELLEARALVRWQWFSSRYVWIAPLEWHGDVVCHWDRHPLEPGAVLCADPVAVCCASNIRRPGRLSALFIHPSLIESTLDRATLFHSSEHQVSGSAGECFERAAHALRRGAPPGELRSHLFALIASARRGVPGLLRASRPASHPYSFAERLESLLETNSCSGERLENLARKLGLDRFQALRAFKQRYGLSPSAYQMCRRIAVAKELLCAGASAAQVALELGFADQSHFGRHFKRLVGVSPGRYAQGSREEARAQHRGCA